MKQLDRDKIDLQGQLKDLEWRLNNESQVHLFFSFGCNLMCYEFHEICSTGPCKGRLLGPVEPTVVASDASYYNIYHLIRWFWGIPRPHPHF